MKLSLSICAFAWLLQMVTSCNQSSTSTNQPIPSQTSTFYADSLKADAIDSISTVLRAYMNAYPDAKYVDSLLIANPKYTVAYFDNKEDGTTLVFVAGKTEDITDFKYFVYKDEVPIRMQYRYWNKLPPQPSTEELFIYFDKDGKIFHTRERSTLLGPDEIPAVLKTIPLTPSKKSEKELYAFYEEFWELAKNAIDKDRVARGNN